MRLTYSALTLLVLLVSQGCEDDFVSTRTPTLLVEPAELVFAKPEVAQDEQTLTLTIRNVGTGDLIIARVGVEEDDEIREIRVLDADDWSGRVISPEAAEQLRVSWRARDARSDQARLIIVNNAGPDVVIPVRTPDLDAQLTVRSQPEAAVDGAEAEIALEQASLGRSQRAVISLESGSVVPLEVERICLLDANGGCLDTPADDPPIFTICQGAPPTPDGCSSPMVPAPLQLDETHVFSAFFTPPDEQPNARVARILIESNAAATPQFVINLRGIVCVRSTETMVCDGCGDLEIGPGEDCDDGNLDDDDDCRNDCTQPRCGDGHVQTGVEECDDGNEIDTDGCRNSCELALCGDGVVQADIEACDDGNDVDTDACTNTCAIAACGDGIVQEGVEACDDGDDVDTNGCLNNCQVARCGDGVVLAFIEQCDDGNDVDTDACLSNCERARCGDGQLHQGVEGCDDGNEVTETCAYGEMACEVCDAACQLTPGVTAQCGDGQTQMPQEACDDGNAITETCPYGVRECVVCDSECGNRAGATSFCGDGRVDADNGEECDEAGAANGCLADCRREVVPPNQCGDGVVQAGEDCDDANDRYCDAETCECIEPLPGPGAYGVGCNRGSECASGLCVPGSVLNPRGQPVATAGYCTMLCAEDGGCPGVDRCETVLAPEAGCPTPISPFVRDGQVDVCLKNETGIPCRNAADCRPGGICLTPPNPPRELVVVQPMCAARCERNDECPVGFECDVIQTDNGPASVCQPRIEIVQCPSGAAGAPACSEARICPGNLRADEHFLYSVCIEYGPGRPGVCSCACRDASDCPTGFACSVIFNHGIPGRAGTCLPMAGYTCPTGQGGQCLSDQCEPSDGRDLSRCTAPCDDRFDCPEGYSCRAQPDGTSRCLP